MAERGESLMGKLAAMVGNNPPTDEVKIEFQGEVK
jgi:hypothetical protein